jgi:hypothetical protein
VRLSEESSFVCLLENNPYNYPCFTRLFDAIGSTPDKTALISLTRSNRPLPPSCRFPRLPLVIMMPALQTDVVQLEVMLLGMKLERWQCQALGKLLPRPTGARQTNDESLPDILEFQMPGFCN